jgi:methylphosphotriester-DNA--protein-cysteine methyltransferase
MARKKYLNNLPTADRETHKEITPKGTLKVRQFKCAMILLRIGKNLFDPHIMAALNVSHHFVDHHFVERNCKCFVVDSIERALNEDLRPSQTCKLGGRSEATLIATVCSRVPERYGRWSLRLLVGKLCSMAWSIRASMKPCDVTQKDA